QRQPPQHETTPEIPPHQREPQVHRLPVTPGTDLRRHRIKPHPRPSFPKTGNTRRAAASRRSPPHTSPRTTPAAPTKTPRPPPPAWPAAPPRISMPSPPSRPPPAPSRAAACPAEEWPAPAASPPFPPPPCPAARKTSARSRTTRTTPD